MTNRAWRDLYTLLVALNVGLSLGDLIDHKIFGFVYFGAMALAIALVRSKYFPKETSA